MNELIKSIPKLVGIDLETTGSSFSDHIVEVALISYEYGEFKDKYVTRVNPLIPIPKVVSLIHGIYDKDVKDKPSFDGCADFILERIEGAVLFGYNVVFDFNVLSNELVRIGRKHLDQKKWTLLDPFVIWKKQDPKTLEHAFRFFCSKELENAHGAYYDISATFEVLDAQLEKYTDLPKTFNELGSYCYPGDPLWVCSSYHFIWNDNDEIICNFGKYKGNTLKNLILTKRSFCEWILSKDFPQDVKFLIKNALEGNDLPKRQK